MKTVFFDVDTQLDFMLPAGALYVRGAEAVLPHIVRLNRYAVQHGSPLISTMDAHEENDEEFHTWPHHCIAGTLGQRKPAETLVGSQVVVPYRKREVETAGAKQIIIEKRVNDAFRNANLAEVLESLAADRYVLYGVVTEICVACAARGLLKTGKRVELVRDAVKELNGGESAKMFEEFTAGGGVLTTVAEVCG